MARRPFEKVSAGPGVVYDTEYNAFLDVARRARGGRDVDLTKIAKGVVVPCVNRTNFDLKAFDVVRIGDPVVTAEDENEFKYKTPVLHVDEVNFTDITFAQLPSWGVLQSACVAGGSSRLMISGVTPVLLEPLLAIRYDPGDIEAPFDERGKTIYFQGPYGMVNGKYIGPFVVGQCEILYQQSFTTEVAFDETPNADDLRVLGLIRFPIIHHELVRATALEAMRPSSDESYRASLRWLNTDYEWSLTFNDWLNITIQKGDRVHLGYFPDKQRLSVITCCSIGSGQADGLGCPCLLESNICHIRVTFGSVATNEQSTPQLEDTACPSCTSWNSRAWELFPPINDPNSCEFVAQDVQNPQFPTTYNAFEEFPCSRPTDQPSFLRLTVSCTSEDDNQSVLEVHIDGRLMFTAVWEDTLFGSDRLADRTPVEVIVSYPENAVGDILTELNDAAANRAANNQGTFDPDTSTPNLKDDAGTLCHNYTVAPSRANPDQPEDYNFGTVANPRNVALKDGDIVVYNGSRWVVIIVSGASGSVHTSGTNRYEACEIDALTDPYGCDWTSTVQNPSIDLEFEPCD